MKFWPIRSQDRIIVPLMGSYMVIVCGKKDEGQMDSQTAGAIMNAGFGWNKRSNKLELPAYPS